MQRRPNYSRGPKPPLHRINNNIVDVDKVRLISGDGGASIVSFRDALNQARNQNLDLVEIASDKGFPICKIIDYGKFKFELLKKEKDNKKKQHVVALKEVKLGVRIDNNDFSNKQKQAQSFLEKGDKVKVSLRFRGREIMHANLGLGVVEKMIEGLSDLGTAEKKPELEGRQIVVIIAPKKNKTKVENTDAKNKNS